MSSPCISGGGRTYGFDLEIVKSSSTSSIITSHTSSPSSTISESSKSPLAISTRKPRTPRKRPNQTYSEAAAILSTAYPSIFSTKHLVNSRKFTKPHDISTLSLDQSSDLLLPFRVFDNSGFLLHQPVQEKPSFSIESKVASFREKSSSCQSSCEVDFHGDSMELELCDGFEEDFDAESILDEEIGEGIDSIMGNLSVGNEMVDDSLCNGTSPGYGSHGGGNYWQGSFDFGGKSQFGNGIAMRRGIRALRHVDEGNWWNFPIVDMLQISPRLNPASPAAAAAAATTTSAAPATNADSNQGPDCNSAPNSIPKPKVKLKIKPPNSSEKKKKKVERLEKVLKPPATAELKNVELVEEKPIKDSPIPQSNQGLLLKLNYDGVLNAWSDRGLPFSDEGLGSAEGNDVSARLAKIDLFSENGMREASVLRYKEKRRARLFSKKIRYQVRKVNADQRPRMKGRFVKRPDSSTSSDDQDEKKKKKKKSSK